MRTKNNALLNSSLIPHSFSLKVVGPPGFEPGTKRL